MDIGKAKKAGELAEQIESLEEKRVRIQAFEKEGWIVTGLRVKSKDGSQETLLPLEAVDAAMSSKTLAYAVEVYDEQVTALSDQLTKL